jgi:iron-sulfur cluster repair protein YtfE (RIC family)
MANEQVLQEPMLRSEVRLDHPQQVLKEISDLFDESADAVTRVREQLERLTEQATRRFASEERSGRYEEVMCHAPWLTARAQELQQQHSDLVETLHRMRSLCESSDGPVAWWQRMQQEFEDFAELLQEHEAAENNLLSEMHPGPAWNQD